MNEISSWAGIYHGEFVGEYLYSQHKWGLPNIKNRWNVILNSISVIIEIVQHLLLVQNITQVIHENNLLQVPILGTHTLPPYLLNLGAFFRNEWLINPYLCVPIVMHAYKHNLHLWNSCRKGYIRFVMTIMTFQMKLIFCSPSILFF